MSNAADGTDAYDIIVIDDDPIFSKVLVTTLQRYGFHPAMFGDPVAGLHAVEANPPRVLILDWSMPELGGQQLLNRIGKNSAWGQMKVFVATATEFSASGKKLLATLGVHKTYIKPVHMEELLADIELALGPSQHA